MNNLEYLKYKEKSIKEDISKEKHRLHNSFFKKYRKTFLILDIIVLLAFICNLGAVLTTNALVVKETTEQGEEVVFNEVNPIQAEVNDYVVHPESKSLVVGVIFQGLIWLIIITIYWQLRRVASTYKELTGLIIIVSFWFMLLSWDFISDFGFLIGKVIWG